MTPMSMTQMLMRPTRFEIRRDTCTSSWGQHSCPLQPVKKTDSGTHSDAAEPGGRT